jgi:hypothetical protein
VFSGLALRMVWSIELDDQFLRETNEVDNVLANGGLAAELVAANLLGAKKLPETLFGIGRFVAELAREVALAFVAVHGMCLPPPQPSPQVGGSRKIVAERKWERATDLILAAFAVLRRKRVDDFYGFHADADDLADEADDVFLIIRLVGVAGDAAAFVSADLVLVDDPIQRAAVAEAVVKDFGRDLGEYQRVVDL